MTDVLDDAYVLGDIEDEGGAALSDQLAEHRLVGHLMLHPEATTEIRDLVSPREFFDRALGRVYERIVGAEGLFTNDDVVEWLAGAEIAGRSGKQAAGYLVSQGADISSDHASVLAQQIFEIGERRLIQEGETNLVGLDAWQSKMGAVLYSERGSFATEEADFIVEDLIPEHELVIIMGDKQTGKSFVTSHIGFSIARGVPFFDRRILEPRPVIWCCYEGGGGARARMRAYSNYFDVQAELPFAALTEPFDLWEKEGNVEELIREVDGICKTQFAGKMPGVLIIDTHNAATTGASEIDSEVVSKIRDRYKAIMRALGCTVIIVGHSNAIGKHRGNGLLENNVPTVLTVSYKTRLENRQAIQVKDNDGRPVRTLHVKYQREGAAGGDFDFVLRGVETGIKNKFGRVRTSCVVTEPNWAEEPEKGEDTRKSDNKSGFRLTDIEDQFFKAFWKALHESGQEAPPELGLSRATKVVHRALVSKLYRQSVVPEDGSQPVSENTLKSRWNRSTGKLKKVGVIGFVEPYFWWTGKPIVGMPATQPQRHMFDDQDHGMPETEFPE